MSTSRRPVTAVVTMLVLVLMQLVADPTGLLALVGWPGGMPQAQLWWPIARYVVFMPVLFGALWFAARTVGGRFWLMTLATVWAVLLAQFVTLFAMTWDVWLAGWGAGYVLAKAVPAALVVAAATKWLGRPSKSLRGAFAKEADGAAGAAPAARVRVPAAVARAARICGRGFWSSRGFRCGPEGIGGRPRLSRRHFPFPMPTGLSFLVSSVPLSGLSARGSG